jgi:hypothetical protein
MMTQMVLSVSIVRCVHIICHLGLDGPDAMGEVESSIFQCCHCEWLNDIILWD